MSNLYLRVYEPHEPRKPPRRVRYREPERVLVFDTETTTDITQQFRVGRYDLYVHGIHTAGAFFYTDDLPMFREVLEREAMKNGSAIVGFNLPFDIAQIASSYEPAKRDMLGGFKFTLSEGSNLGVRVKHLGAHKTMIKWSGKYTKGVWIDCQMLGAALVRPCSLAETARRLQTKHRKIEGVTHGTEIDKDYLRYLKQDVQVTYECFLALSALWKSYGLEYTSLDRIYSEASIGKAALKQIGIEPFHSLNPGFPDSVMGAAMESFFGGRSEVHIRKQSRRVVHVDFLSMYPTVCALMGLWKFVTAKELRVVHEPANTARVEKLLSEVQLSDLFRPGFWRGLNSFVQVLPNDDVFPVRSDYTANGSPSIGLNYLSTAEPVWYTLADCIVSVLLSGKVPTVVDAHSIVPHGRQSGLKAWNIMGDSRHHVDPYVNDFYAQLVQLKAELKGDARESVKYVANSTSYGIFAELNERKDRNTRHEYRTGLDTRMSRSRPSEEPGTYHSPVLATFITGAARLMLATLERQVLDAGLGWCFCDTDSMSIAIEHDSDLGAVQTVVDSYEQLSPYPKLRQLLTVEHGLKEPTFCYAISAKRYALYTLASDKTPTIVKCSAHGLGHLRSPDGDTRREGNVPLWVIPVWEQLVSSESTLNTTSKKTRYPNTTLLQTPAMSQFTVTSPLLLRYGMTPYSFASVFRTNMSYHGKATTCVAPFNTDAQSGAKFAKSVIDGRQIAARFLETYEDAISNYTEHHESKFLGGDSVGVLRRRHMSFGPTDRVSTGKTGGHLEEQELGLIESDIDEYKTPLKVGRPKYQLPPAAVEQLSYACDVYGVTEIAKRLGVAKQTLWNTLKTCSANKILDEKIVELLRGLVM